MFVLISQVFSLVLALVAISKSYVDFRARRESLQMFVLWTLTWMGIVIVALFPGIIDVFLGGSRRGIGTFFGMAGVLMFFLLYRVYARVVRLERRISILVQEAALREARERDEISSRV
jgi:small membrane protein